ncbi:MAG: hypothetical protein QW728_02305, partial [Thermoplasmata archaeon]
KYVGNSANSSSNLSVYPYPYLNHLPGIIYGVVYPVNDAPVYLNTFSDSEIGFYDDWMMIVSTGFYDSDSPVLYYSCSEPDIMLVQDENNASLWYAVLPCSEDRKNTYIFNITAYDSMDISLFAVSNNITIRIMEPPMNTGSSGCSIFLLILLVVILITTSVWMYVRNKNRARVLEEIAAESTGIGGATVAGKAEKPQPEQKKGKSSS